MCSASTRRTRGGSASYATARSTSMSSAVRGADHAWAFRPLLGRAPVVRLLPVRLLLLLLGPATVLPHLLAGPALVLLLPPRMGPAMVPTRLLVLNHLRRAAVTPGFLAGRRPHQGDDGWTRTGTAPSLARNGAYARIRPISMILFPRSAPPVSPRANGTPRIRHLKSEV